MLNLPHVAARAIAEDKITNPRHGMLYAGYVALRKAADAIRDRCDRITVKIRLHRRAKRDKAELPNAAEKLQPPV